MAKNSQNSEYAARIRGFVCNFRELQNFLGSNQTPTYFHQPASRHLQTSYYSWRLWRCTWCLWTHWTFLKHTLNTPVIVRPVSEGSFITRIQVLQEVDLRHLQQNYLCSASMHTLCHYGRKPNSHVLCILLKFPHSTWCCGLSLSWRPLITRFCKLLPASLHPTATAASSVCRLPLSPNFTQHSVPKKPFWRRKQNSTPLGRNLGLPRQKRKDLVMFNSAGIHNCICG